MTLPPFPVDDTTLDLLEAAMDPWSHGHPEAESSHLYSLLDKLSTLAGSDTTAVEREDDGVRIMRDPAYETHAIITALIAEVRRLRGTSCPTG